MATRLSSGTLKAGLFYFLTIFAVGFFFGVIRVVVLVPRLGEIGAVAMEIPFMLGISWVVCKRLVTRYAVPAAVTARFAMGILGFILLIAAEFILALTLFHLSVGGVLQTYRKPEGWIGLSGQIAFAFVPAIQMMFAKQVEALK